MTASTPASVRWPSRVLVLAFLTCFLLVPVSSHAQVAHGQLPEWSVLVLQLVSETHVVPATGIVISTDGQVLVPAEVTAGGHPLVVLDGGADVVRNGRPAQLVSRMNLAGLAVLQVAGLSRTPARLAPEALLDGQAVRLAAFPPAEQIAIGMGLVMRMASVSLDDAGQPSLDAGTPLPNVTGPLTDACNQLVGFSAARGVQSLATTMNTAYHWRDSLASTLGDQIQPGEVCTESFNWPPPEPQSQAQPESRTPPESESQREPQPEPQSQPESESEPEPEPVASTPVEAPDTGSVTSPETGPEPNTELPENEGEEPAAGAAEVVEQVADEAVEQPTPVDAGWPWLKLAAPGALFLLILAWWLHRRHEARKPRLAFLIHPVGDAPCVKDRAVIVQKGVIDVTLGRFEANIILNADTVSRCHARLLGKPDALTIIDLGSSNGTRVNGAQCPVDVAVPVRAGDEIAFGNAHYLLLTPEQEIEHQ